MTSSAAVAPYSSEDSKYWSTGPVFSAQELSPYRASLPAFLEQPGLPILRGETMKIATQTLFPKTRRILPNHTRCRLYSQVASLAAAGESLAQSTGIHGLRLKNCRDCPNSLPPNLLPLSQIAGMESTSSAQKHRTVALNKKREAFEV